MIFEMWKLIFFNISIHCFSDRELLNRILQLKKNSLFKLQKKKKK